MTVVQVDTTTTVGTVQQKLRGVGNIIGNVGEGAYDAGAEAVLQPYVNLHRIGKLEQATAISTSQDAAHPTAGRAGSPYFYDWTAVDLMVDHVSAFGSIYIESGGCPQILGGSVAPLTGSARTTTNIAGIQWASALPNNLTNWGWIVGDLFDHLINVKGITPAYWEPWNEPDGGFLSPSSQANLQAIYAATAPVVRSVSPSTKIGGPGTSSWNSSWVQGFINYAATNSLPLDFIGFHEYGGDISVWNRARVLTDRYLAAAGLSTGLPLSITEWAPLSNACFYGDSNAPWNALHYGDNDWAGAFTGAWMIEAQRCNTLNAARFAPHSEDNASYHGYFSAGLASSTAMWSSGNIYRMWSMLQPTTVKTTVLGGDGGLFAQWSRNAGSTHHTALLSNLHFRQGRDELVTLRAPGVSGSVTAYVMDKARSNMRDAGSSHAALETMTAPVIDAGRIRVQMKPRSVVLLDIA